MTKKEDSIDEFFESISTNSIFCGEGKVHIIANKKPLTQTQVDEIINRVSLEDLVKIEAFNQLLWIATSSRNHRCDCTRCYWNPIRKILFIGYEGIRFKSKSFVKNIPLSILPKGWRIIIRNIWTDKYNYDYATQEEIPREETEEWEDLICSPLEWCVHNKRDLKEIFDKANDLIKNMIENVRK